MKQEKDRPVFQLFLSQPIGSMYGLFTYIYHKHPPNVGTVNIPVPWILWPTFFLNFKTLFSVGSRYLLEKVRVTKIDKQEIYSRSLGMLFSFTSQELGKMLHVGGFTILEIPYERNNIMPE